MTASWNGPIAFTYIGAHDPASNLDELSLKEWNARSWDAPIFMDQASGNRAFACPADCEIQFRI